MIGGDARAVTMRACPVRVARGVLANIGLMLAFLDWLDVSSFL